LTGSFEMSAFHTLSVGKTVQVVPGSVAAVFVTRGAAGPVSEPDRQDGADGTAAAVNTNTASGAMMLDPISALTTEGVYRFLLTDLGRSITFL
jgi:hypothetical protein